MPLKAAATIVPYDVQSRIREAFPDILEQRIVREVEKLEARVLRSENQIVDAYQHPERPATVIPVNSVIPGRRATVEGRISQVEDNTTHQELFRSIVVGDETGEIRATFWPGAAATTSSPGSSCGSPERCSKAAIANRRCSTQFMR
ncbi:hypothetical protein [Candidatus Mycobacterium methanotrophicum]|uniref:OB domain-containing protein n=1 Tax=Candidatus Mycobacterium methanotrophicum TaxID=2943498 RepID=A0ABY4QK48_9MYCO|nr:hypothetical protein [Candidatus Mycobacterium methanotrophicum]UQX10366.1 hypothetical protein M5I08_19915 [Candidatus Mycobacterium methanotrophicum]